jgi:hypothetical protein
VTTATIAGWARGCQCALLEIAQLWQPVIEKQARRVGQFEFAVAHLHRLCWSTSESALFLASHGKLWDAEILTRTVLEGTFQALALCLTEPSARSATAEEYLDHMPDISHMRRHRRAGALLKLSSLPLDHPTMRPISDVLLSAEEIATLEAKYPRKQRSLMEERWSLTKLIERVSSMEGAWKELAAMSWSHMVASPIVHLGGETLQVILDREQRSEERRLAIELAHGSRLVTDQLVLARLRTIGVYHAEGLDLKPIWEQVKEPPEWRQEAEQAYLRWHELEYGSRME